MKCPKCNYIAFDSTVRCRNCGFDFSLTRAVEPAGRDLPLRHAEPAAPLQDFDLGAAKRPAVAAGTPAAAARTPDPSFDPGVPPVPAGELPLFGEGSLGDEPLVRPSAPSAPLSVRRSTPAPARTRPPLTPRHAEARAAPELPLGRPSFSTLGLSDAEPAPADGEAERSDVAGVGVRLGAAAIDWVMLFALDLIVVYFTLRVSRLQAAEILLLPLAPLLGFIVLLNGGYLAMFTAAGGQTLGKMAFNLRVVSCDEKPVTIGRALLRVVSCLAGAIPAGAGLLPAAFDGQRRAVHDRLAGTRVVHVA